MLSILVIRLKRFRWWSFVVLTRMLFEVLIFAELVIGLDLDCYEDSRDPVCSLTIPAFPSSLSFLVTYSPDSLAYPLLPLSAALS
jgi:hypothetical protein